ncbi:sucrose-specific PTS transporter subunit IIBC [Kocuria sp. ZOR0020]|uniref:sucrose-specific PTS transporter subunit IIBC n=1 Tax=Kocuria sp. ZOR0020 TaxID=1339234 RepID=UPI0009DF767C|nr:sucrose-specific PTS transporter subunit IIBC [Kocuria sp. ZOR0020]
MDHSQVATRVLAAVGGPENINAAAHCATRLRLVLADQDKVDQKALDDDADVKGTFLAGGMYQIIIGPGDVDIVYGEMVSKGGVREVSKDEAKQVAAEKENPVIRLIKTIADIFVPILPALIAGGLMMAINNVLTAPELFGEQSVVEMFPAIADYAELINMISAAAFAFLPVLIAFSAVKRFGGNVYLGAAMGAAMVSPSLVNAYDYGAMIEAGEAIPAWHLFGLTVEQVGYQAQVIPVLFVSWLLVFIEKRFHKIFKGTADFLLTPLFTMLITGFLAFIIVGPLTRVLSNGITDGLSWLYESANPFGGLVFGLLYSPIVVTGLHQSFPAVELPLINEGGSFIFPIATMANVAQGAVCLAVFLRARDAKLKGISGASSASALFGITEPAIFGVNLRLRWPFFLGLAAAGIGATLVAIFDVRAMALGAAGLVGFVSIRPTDIPMYLVIMAITFAIAFTAALVYGSTRGRASIAGTTGEDNLEDQEAAAEAAALHAEEHHAPAATHVEIPEEAAFDYVVAAPVDGEAITLDQVKDETFASGMLGPGGAIVPSNGPVVSPVDGKVVVAFPTAHAYALRSESGVDVLIHIGMDTVKLQGEHFTPKVVKGQTVRRGDVLAEVDWKAVAAAGYDLTTPVVVSNAKKLAGVETTFTPGQITAGAHFLEATAKSEEVTA